VLFVGCPRLADGVLATENELLTLPGSRFEFPVLIIRTPLVWECPVLFVGCPRLADGVLATENELLTLPGSRFEFPVLIIRTPLVWECPVLFVAVGGKDITTVLPAKSPARRQCVIRPAGIPPAADLLTKSCAPSFRRAVASRATAESDWTPIVSVLTSRGSVLTSVTRLGKKVVHGQVVCKGRRGELVRLAFGRVGRPSVYSASSIRLITT
jgi:hypothetical protein